MECQKAKMELRLILLRKKDLDKKLNSNLFQIDSNRSIIERISIDINVF